MILLAEIGTITFTMYQVLVDHQDLRQFLGADVPAAKCRLMLPHFAGTTTLAGDTAPGNPLLYRGFTFAERDSRAAFHVHSLVAPVFEPGNIAIESAIPGQPVPPTAFLFGSRTNPVTQEVLRDSGRGLFGFEFGTLWKIRCSGREFSMPDPSQLTDATQYQNTRDYAVMAKLHDTENHNVFMIAGLGGRATEGAAQFFVNHWRELAADFGDDDFAVILQFDIPFNLNNCSIVISARRPHSLFRYA